jgi:hypothetical protein
MSEGIPGPTDGEKIDRARAYLAGFAPQAEEIDGMAGEPGLYEKARAELEMIRFERFFRAEALPGAASLGELLSIIPAEPAMEWGSLRCSEGGRPFVEEMVDLLLAAIFKYR